MRKDSQYERFGMPPFKSRNGCPARRAILEGNKALRDGRLRQPKKLGRHEGFAGTTLRIPELDFGFIRAMFPEVNSKDHEIRRKAWLKFANSPMSEPYRVHRFKRGPQCRSITAR